MKEKTAETIYKMIIILILGILAFSFIIIPIHKYSLNEITGRAITGGVVTKVVIISESNAVCQINLTEGWNLISIPCRPSNNTIQLVLEPIQHNYSSIHTYLAIDLLDPWKSYNPTLPSWVYQDLEAIKPEEGYWIYMNKTDSMIVNGTLILPAAIELKEGWNLVGYPTNQTQEVNSSFSTILDTLISAHAYNSSDLADPWKSYNPSLPPSAIQDLNYTVPYWGYWISLSDEDEWKVW